MSQDHELIQRAFLKIKELEHSRDQLSRSRRAPIAVIGMGCRFPAGLDSPDAFFDFLLAKKTTVGPLPERLRDGGRHDHLRGGFFERVDLFDPGLFRISAKEARYLDPQQRFLLEVAWQTLEDAAYPTSRLAAARTGVFVGMTGMEYSRHVEAADAAGTYGVTGITHNGAVGRLSFALGLRGPAVAVDAACASSLVAVDQAVQSLRRGACDYALAGGVNLVLSTEANELIDQASMLSPTGACHTFDAAADGYVRGEGCGLVLLKPLDQAQADGDTIYAVIRGSGVNNNGTGGGFTVPNGIAQERLIHQALTDCGVEPGSVDYVEAHGTGTALGDPVEVNALQAVLGQGEGRQARPLAIGSVKTNLGHLESAAGIAGLIKAIMALHRGTLPPQIHFHQPNPQIPWPELGVEVVTEARPWNDQRQTDSPRCCGVSSFGISGTNAHVILQQAPAAERPANEDPPAEQPQTEPEPLLLLLSAHDDKSLRARAEQSRELLQDSTVDPRDLCHTALRGRTPMPQRLALYGRDRGQLGTGLDAFLQTADSIHALAEAVGQTGRGQTRHGKSLWLFTGQGAQYPGMGGELYGHDKTFRRAMDRCAEILDPLLGRSSLDLILGRDDDPEAIHHTALAQPCLFTLEYALCCLWRQAGLKPSMLLGHSLGEYVAAQQAGVFDLEDALCLVTARGRLMGELPAGGAMATVFAAPETVAQALTSQAGDRQWNEQQIPSLAAINGDSEVVISGPRSSLEAVLQEFADRGIKTRSLKVSHAFHSPLMDPVLEPFARVAKDVTYHAPKIKIISNLTVDFAHQELTNAQYWVSHLRDTVRFTDGLGTAFDAGCTTVLEIGPHPVLTGLAQRLNQRRAEEGDRVFLSSLRRRRDGRESVQRACGRLFVLGHDLEWPTWSGRRRPLPTYPFQRQSYWLPRPRPQTGEPSPAPLDLRADPDQQRLADQLQSFAPQLQALDRLAIHRLHGVLTEMGLPTTTEDSLSIEQLHQRLKIAPRHRQLFAAQLRLLHEAGYLRLENDRVQPVDPANYPSPATTAAQSPHLELLDRCLSQYPLLLRGELDPVEVLFAAGSSELLEGIYSANPLSRFHNHQVARSLDALLRRRAQRSSVDSSAPLRVLEVGCGTASTAEKVLELCDPWLKGLVYACTDLSPGLVKVAQSKLGERYSCCQFQVLDVEKAGHVERFGAGTWDVVIATNVLHATRDIGRTLSHISRLLRPDGAVVINELVSPSAAATLTFGLTEGWWLFKDGDSRLADSPLLSVDGWRAALADQGFRGIHLPAPEGAEDEARQAVLVAWNHAAHSPIGAPADRPTAMPPEPVAGDFGLDASAQEVPTQELPTQGHTAQEVPAQGGPMPGVDPQAALLATLVRLVSDAIETRPEDIQTDVGFFNLGADSVVLMQIKAAVDELFELETERDLFYQEDADIQGLADWLWHHLPEDSPFRRRAEGSVTSAHEDLAVLPSPDGGPITSLLAGQIQTLRTLMEQQNALLAQLEGRSVSAPASTPASPILVSAPRPTPPAVAHRSQADAKTGKTAFVPYKRIEKRQEIAAEQAGWRQTYLPELVQNVTRLTAGSKAHTQEYRRQFANNRNIAGFRSIWKEMTYQIVAERSRGSKIWDVDGQEFIDLTMGFGVSFFGHDADFIRQAVQEQLSRSFSVGPIPDLAGDVARRICRLTGMDRAAFYNSGTEAVMVAIRLARTVTDRAKVAIFAGSYHGMFDGILALKRGRGEHAKVRPMAPGVPQSLIDDVVVLDYDDPAALDELRRLGPELAAVLVEPVQSRRPDLQPRAFLHQLRRLTEEQGAALIFDEIVTGFRTGNGGAQEAFGVRADLATYGKVIGGGLPMGVVAGSARFLDAVDGGHWQYGDDSVPQSKNTFVAGTFCYHPLSMAAAGAVLRRLEEAGGDLQRQTNDRTADMCRRLNRWFAQIWPDASPLPVRMCWFGSLFRFVLDGERDLLFQHLLAEGIYVWEGRNCFLSTAHDEQDVATIIQAVQSAVIAMAGAGLMPAITESTPGPSPDESRGEPQPTVLPLLPEQQRLWFLQQMDGDAALAYQESITLELHGELDVAALQWALGQVARRHQSLRVVRLDDQGQTVLPAAGSGPTIELPVDRLDSGDDSFSDAESWARHHGAEAFDLERGPLWRARLLLIGPRRRRLLLTFHHLIVDGWSMNLLLQELAQLYTEGAGGLATPLPAVIDLAAVTSPDRVEKSTAVTPDTPLSTAGPVPLSPKSASMVGRRMAFHLPTDLGDQLRGLAQNQGVGLFSCLAAAFLALWRRSTDEHCCTLGVPHAAHLDLGMPHLVAPLSKVLPQRYHLSSDLPFAELMAEIHRRQIRSTDEIRSSETSAGETAQGPIRALFNLDRGGEPLCFGRLGVDFVSTPVSRVKFDLALNVFDHQGTLWLELDHRLAVLAEADAEAWLEAYVAVLESVVEDPHGSLGTLTHALAQVPKTELQQNSSDDPVTTEPVAAVIEDESTEGEVSDDHTDAVVEVWRQVLGRPQLRPDDHFFELGGNSLAATRIVSRLRRDLGLSVRLRDLFTAPTARALAALAKPPAARLSTLSVTSESDEVESNDKTFALSNAQKRLWLAYQKDPLSTVYNMSSTFSLRGELNTPALSQALEALVQRHESLRTRFESRQGEPRQKVVEPRFDLEVVDLSQLPNAEAEARRLDAEAALRPYDLEHEPLFRAVLFRLEETEHALALNMHHIVGDGWSMGVLLEQLVELYNHQVSHGRLPEPAPTSLQYRHYVRWLEDLLNSELGKTWAQYWRRRLASSPAEAALPLDFPRPSHPAHRGATLTLDFDPQLTGRLYALAQGEQASPFMLVCAAVRTLLFHQSGRRDLILGTPYAGRDGADWQDADWQDADWEDQVGFYLNTLALRAEVDPQASFIDLLSQVKERATEDFEHGLWPFDRLVEDLVDQGLAIEPGRHPLFDVMVLCQQDRLREPLDGLTLTPFKDEIVTDQFDLTFNFEQRESAASDTLRCYLRYDTDLFRGDTVEAWADELRRLLELLPDHADEPLMDFCGRLPGQDEQQEQEAFLMATADLGDEF